MDVDRQLEDEHPLPVRRRCGQQATVGRRRTDRSPPRRVLPDWDSPRQPIHAVVSNSRRQTAKVKDFIAFVRTVV